MTLNPDWKPGRKKIALVRGGGGKLRDVLAASAGEGGAKSPTRPAPSPGP
jgi:hypothetical protein